MRKVPAWTTFKACRPAIDIQRCTFLGHPERKNETPCYQKNNPILFFFALTVLTRSLSIARMGGTYSSTLPLQWCSTTMVSCAAVLASLSDCRSSLRTRWHISSNSSTYLFSGFGGVIGNTHQSLHVMSTVQTRPFFRHKPNYFRLPNTITEPPRAHRQHVYKHTHAKPTAPPPPSPPANVNPHPTPRSRNVATTTESERQQPQPKQTKYPPAAVGGPSIDKHVCSAADVVVDGDGKV